MKRVDYEKMIDNAIDEFEGMDINYIGLLTCLKGTNQRRYDYVPIREVVKAKERIDTLKRLKNLGLLK